MVAKRRTRAAKTGADHSVQEEQVQDVQAADVQIVVHSGILAARKYPSWQK